MEQFFGKHLGGRVEDGQDDILGQLTGDQPSEDKKS